MLGVAIAAAAAVLFIIGYRVYGGYLENRVFRVTDGELTPAVARKDGVDYVPTRRSILFGHHFASIAGLGPILGPAVAVIWGWLPALLWIVLGAILIGAVHDYGSLVVSARTEGKSIGEVLGRVVSPRARILFMLLTAYLIALAMGVFAHIVGSLFAKMYPEAVVSAFGLMLVAVVMGLLLYRLGLPLAPVTIGGLVAMLLLLAAGVWLPVNLYKVYLEPAARARVVQAEKQLAERSVKPAAAAVAGDLKQSLAPDDKQLAIAVDAAASRAQTAWVWVLLAYAFVASVLPVWLLLQPRDYINSYLLYFGVAGIFVGMVLLRPEAAAPAYIGGAALAQRGAPALFPLLFVMVACGAVSGFHCMVASGTTCKQLARMRDARFIGYGGMLAEGLLAVGVLLACAFAVGHDKFEAFYGTWSALTRSLASQIAAFVEGAGNLFNAFGIPHEFGRALTALVVVSFALTTLDTGTRLLRYNLEELAGALRLPLVGNRFVATTIGVLLLAFFAFIKVRTPQGPQPAGLAIWQLFGISNQILAALTMLGIAAYLRAKGRATWPYVLPFLFMLVITAASLYYRLQTDYAAHNWKLAATGTVTAILSLWLTIEAFAVLIRRRVPAEGSQPLSGGQAA